MHYKISQYQEQGLTLSMQGYKSIEPKLLYQVTLDDLVPKDNFYRKLSEAVDFQFLYKETEKYYGTEGQASIDPVVFFKVLIVGYLNNIVSDRRLIEYCSNCLDIRLFLKYDLDEKLPWHSTISRTRQLYSEEVFLRLFRQILTKCVEKGMVGGKRQAVDSVFIKANASMDSMQLKGICEDAKIYAEQLNEASEFQSRSEQEPKVNQEGQENLNESQSAQKLNSDQSNDRHDDKFQNTTSNKTHISITDPDARVSTKPGKQCLLNYLGQIAVDDKSHVIVGALADFADKRDSQSLEIIVDQSTDNLELNQIDLGLLLADANYSSGQSLEYLQSKQIDALIPNHGKYKPDRKYFSFNDQLNQYECQRGNRAILELKGCHDDGRGNKYKIYRSKQTACKDCPFIEQCCGAKTKYKKIQISVHKELFDQMNERYKKPDARSAATIRAKTVEPVLGSLINYFGLKKLYSKGIKAASKHCLMASLCYNLKKMMKKADRKTESLMHCLEIRLKTADETFYNRFIELIVAIRHYLKKHNLFNITDLIKS